MYITQYKYLFIYIRVCLIPVQKLYICIYFYTSLSYTHVYVVVYNTIYINIYIYIFIYEFVISITEKVP